MTTEALVLSELIRQGNWRGYHLRRAESYRNAVARWKETAREVVKSDPAMAVFAMERANENSQWADEAEQLAEQKGTI